MCPSSLARSLPRAFPDTTLSKCCRVSCLRAGAAVYWGIILRYRVRAARQAGFRVLGVVPRVLGGDPQGARGGPRGTRGGPKDTRGGPQGTRGVLYARSRSSSAGAPHLANLTTRLTTFKLVRVLGVDPRVLGVIPSVLGGGPRGARAWSQGTRG